MSTRRSYRVLCFVTGALAFSNLSMFILRDLLGLPLYLPELLILPWLLARWRWIRPGVRAARLGDGSAVRRAFCLAAWVVLLFLGFLGTGGLADALASGRSILYIMVVAMVAARMGPPEYDTIFYLCLGSVVGDLVTAIYLVSPADDSDALLSSANMVAVFLVLALPILFRRTWWQIVTLIICALLLLNAGFRALIVVALLALVLSHGFMQVRRGSKGRLSQLFTLAIGASLAAAAVVFYVQSVGLSDYQYFRLVARSVAFATGDIAGSQDDEKAQAIRRTWAEVGERTVPQGFIMKGKDRVGLYLDSPFVHLYDAIGSLLAWMLLLWIGWRGLRFLLAQLRSPDITTDSAMAVSVGLFAVLMLLNGRFLYITHESWLFGLALGRWLAPTGRAPALAASAVAAPVTAHS